MVAGDNRVGSTTTDDGGVCVAVGGAIGGAGAPVLQPTKVTRTKALMANIEVLVLCHNSLCNSQSLVNRMTPENPPAIILSSPVNAQMVYDDRSIAQERGKSVTRLWQVSHKRLEPQRQTEHSCLSAGAIPQSFSRIFAGRVPHPFRPPAGSAGASC